MIVRRLLAKISGCAAASPASTISAICASFAERNTSAGAPSSSCVASVVEPARLARTAAPGCAASNAAAISVTASVSEDAANTVSGVPGAAGGAQAPSSAARSSGMRGKKIFADNQFEIFILY